MAKVPRGAVKAFRDYMNARYADSKLWKHGRYGQSVSKYGDYLYRQDREKFDVELQDALAGHDGYPGFKFPGARVDSGSAPK